MKKIILFSALAYIICSANVCNKEADGTVLKGRLVIEEPCAHYVVQIIDGSFDASMVVNGWKDDKRNITYNNVFSVASRCSFPGNNLKEGDEFEFVVDTHPASTDCVVCLASYPTPPKAHAIRVVNQSK